MLFMQFTLVGTGVKRVVADFRYSFSVTTSDIRCVLFLPYPVVLLQ